MDMFRTFLRMAVLCAVAISVSARASVDDANENGSISGGGGGSSSLSFKADLFSGKFTYAVPIVVAPGRQGAQPTLALGYNSGGGNGWCGVGWSLDVGFIQRDGRKGVPIKWAAGSPTPLKEYDDAKGFVASVGSASSLVLVATNQSTLVYRQDVEASFMTYNLTDTNCWLVIDKSGNKFYFGETPNSRMSNTNTGWATNSSKSTFKWMLSRVVDVNGNQTTLSYTNDLGQLYLANISYNENINAPALPATHTVDFVLVNRPDTNITFNSGYRVTTRKRLSEVVVKANSLNVRKYVLSYESSPSTLRAMLKSVTQYGSDFASALPPITFNYNIKPPEFETTNQWTGLNSQGNTTSSGWSSTSDLNGSSDYIVKTIDIDGDGLPDRVMRKENSPYSSFHVERNTGSGFAAFDSNGQRYVWAPLDSQGLTDSSAWNSPVGIGEERTHVDLIDINGDGYPDRVMQNQTNVYSTCVFIDYVHGYRCTQHYDQTNFWVQFNNGIVFNGINANSFSYKTLWPGVTNNEAAVDDEYWGAVRFKTVVDLLDMNGDGLVDRISRKKEGPFDRFKVQVNTGNGFNPPVDWYPLQSQGNTDSGWNSPSKTSSDNTYVMLTDINGDGLPDRVMRKESAPFSHFFVQFNNGAGFEPQEIWGNLDHQGNDSVDWGSPIGSGGKAVWATLLDINADGLPDRVMRRRTSTGAVYTNWVVQFNTGVGFAAATNWGPIQSKDPTSSSLMGVSYRNSDSETVVDCFDINGDGLPDRVMRQYSSPYNAYVVQLNKGPFPDLLNAVSNGIGGSIHVSYTPSTTLDNRHTNWVSDPWREGTKSLLAYNTWVVSKIAVSDGMGWWATNSYAYKGGYHNTDKREFRGFAEVEATDPAGSVTKTYFHQSGGRDNSGLGEYQDANSYTKKGLPYRVDVFGKISGTNKLFKTTLSKVEEIQLHPNGWYFPFVSQTVVMDYEDLNTYRATAKQLVYETNYGNLLTEITLGEVNNVDVVNHGITNIGNDSLFTHYTYANLGPIKNKPASIKVSADVNGTIRLKESQFGYDSRGNITNAQVWLDTAAGFITTASTVYDQYGNPVETTDAAGIKTTVIYDSNKQYGEKQITGTFTNRFWHDSRAGLLIMGIDPKGLVASNHYDVFYRTKETFISTTTNGPANLWRTRTEYSLGGISAGISANFVRKRVNDAVDTVNGHETYAVMDGLGRGIQSRTEAENGQFRVSHSFYDSRGNEYYSTLPKLESGTTHTKPNGNYLGTLTEFDSLGRQFRVTPAVQFTFNAGQLTGTSVTGGDSGSPVGPVISAFSEGTNPWVSIATDSEGKIKKSYHDAFSRITQIVEVTSSGNLNTTYSYDLLGNLTNVTDHLGNSIRMSYDSLGRKTAMTDPDMGVWSYSYDTSGRMTQQIDARTNKIKFFYSDVLGRMTSKEIYNAANQLVGTTTWIYDVSDDANYTVFPGQLYKTVDQQGYQRNSYDFRDRVLKSGRFLNFNSMEYVTQNTYDEADRVTHVTYPGNAATIRYTYDTLGNVSEVRSLSGTGTNHVFYTPLTYNELGQLTSYSYGNGVVTSNRFYANSKRIENLSARKSGTSIQSLNYTYDKVSNIKTIGDNVYSGSASAALSSLQYDDLHRLVSVNSIARGVKAYSYNAIGNLLVNEDSGTNVYQYGARPHAVTSANGKSYSYDACGNMVTRGSQILVYDEQNQLVRVTDGTNIVTFGYAEGGERLWRAGTNGYTLWVGSYEINNGKVLCHVFAGGKRVASFEPQCTAGLAKIFGEERWYAASTGIESILNWPLQNGRASWTMLAGTFAAIFVLCGLTRRNADGTRGRMRWGVSLLWQRAVTLTFIASLISATTPNVYAQSYSPVFYYYHGDHLGSSNLMTDPSGNVIQHYENSSYGAQTFKDNSSAFAISNRYTGQILDEETGLYYYGARYYDPELARFIQADTIVPSAVDPQTLNRYAYCANNPLKYVDPDGHDFGLTAFIVGVLVGAAIGGATAAASGGNIWMGILTGAISGAIGGLGAGIGTVIFEGTKFAALGAFAGAVIGGAAGGAATAAIRGEDIGMGALVGAIAGGIGFGVGQLGVKLDIAFENPQFLSEHMANAAVSSVGGAAGGAVGALVTGGDPLMGALYGGAGAFAATALYGILSTAADTVEKYHPRQTKKDLIDTRSSNSKEYGGTDPRAAEDQPLRKAFTKIGSHLGDKLGEKIMNALNIDQKGILETYKDFGQLTLTEKFVMGTVGLLGLAGAGAAYAAGRIDSISFGRIGEWRGWDIRFKLDPLPKP